jgi:MFS family permease
MDHPQNAGHMPPYLSPRKTISAYFFCSGLVFATWAARIPFIKDRFELNDASLGGILFMLPLGSVSALPIAGWVIGRFGSRIVTAFSAMMYAFLLWQLCVVNAVVTLSFVLFLFGFVGDLMNISMNTQGLSVQRLLKKPILSGLHAHWSFGALAGALTGGWSLRLSLTTQQHFLLIALLVALASMVFSFFMVADSPQEDASIKIFTWPDKSILLLGLICFCNTMAEGAMADWSSLYYRQLIVDNSKVTTTGYVAFTLAMAIGRLCGDRVIQTLRYRKTLMLNGLLTAAGLILAIAWPHPVAVIFGYALVGLGVSSVIPIVYMMVGKSSNLAPAAALSAVSAIGFTGFLIGPPVIGLIAQYNGLRLSLLVIALLGGMIFVLAAKGVKK